LPNFDIYNTGTKTSSQQVPINIASRPANNTYFIGTPQGTSDKLLCYHITDGRYIVISYNYSSAKLLQNVLDTDIYEIKIAEYEDNEIKHENPDNIPVINSSITNIT
jgi:hypothetical protein